MRILVSAGYTPSLSNFRGPLLRALIAAGHEVHACGPEREDSTLTSLASWGVQFWQVDLARTGMNPLRDGNSFLSLLRLMRELRPDVYLGYTVKPVIYGSMAARVARVPKVFSLITGLGYSFMGHTWKQRAAGAVVRRLYRRALRGNRLVFFQNEDDQTLFRELGLIGKRVPSVVLSGSGVDLEHYRPMPIPAVESGRLVFCLVARLIAEKGIVEYVEAARIVRKNYPHVRFQLAGGIERRPDAISEAQIWAWVRAGDVEYLGELADVRPCFANCHVYVLPSYREGTPRTVLEAMAAGRAIVTTDVPGCRQTVVSGFNGMLVPARDPIRLADALTHFLRNPDSVSRMGEASLTRVRELYDVRQVNEVMLREMGLTGGGA